MSKSRFIYPQREDDVELPEDCDQAVASLFESRRGSKYSRS